MPLTTAQICALLLGAGTLGATGGAVAVHKSSKPKITLPSAAKGKPGGVEPSRSRVVRSEQAVRPASILDCPVATTPVFTNYKPEMSFTELLTGKPAEQVAIFVDGPPYFADDDDWVPFPPVGVPGVPDASQWVQMLAGFGLLGLSFRRRRREPVAPTINPPSNMDGLTWNSEGEYQ